MMLRTLRLRDGSVVRIALWRDATSGKIDLVIEAEPGWLPTPAATVVAAPPAQIAPRLVLRPPTARPPAPPIAAASWLAHPTRSLVLKLAPHAPPHPRVLGAPRAALMLARPEAPAPAPPTISPTVVPPPPSLRLYPSAAPGLNAAPAALHPESKSLAAVKSMAEPNSHAPLPPLLPTDVGESPYEAAFLLGPIAG